MERLKHIVQINILLGAWLIVAPFILGYSGSTLESGNDIVTGVVLIGCSWWILAAMRGQVGASALQLLGGLWLIAAPFYFHYEKLSRAYTNDLIAGVLVVMVGATASWMLAAKLRTRA
jgi:thiol:disulfide interchange protein